MKKGRIKIGWLLIPLIAAIVITIFLSCSKDLNVSDFVAGDAFTDSKIRVVLIDTFTVATSTMKFDSILTSQSSRMLLGKYTDPVFGTVRCSTFMELLPTSYTIGTEAEYDSIVFYLGLDKYYYNDTLQTSTLHIRQLQKRLKPKNGDYFYNTSTVDYANSDIGTLSFKPRPLIGDSLGIKVSDSLGIDMFGRLQDKMITNLDEFREYFKGVTILPDELDQGAIVGFSLASDKSYMRLYYSTPEEEERVQGHIDFSINTVSSPIPFFNRITSEEPNEYLKTLTDKEINLMSSVSDNRSFIQSGIGIATRIQFPFIKNIYDIPGQGTLLEAVLKIRPAGQSYNDHLILRDSLSLYIVDVNNELTEQLSQIAVLNRANQEFNDIYYQVDLGSYIEKLQLAERNTGEALILLPDNYNSTIDRFVLNGNNNSKFSTILELTYAIYDADE
tara:strand:- start:2065 stop:3399 length:1335 start_codon:yes stop_codon:yes gene_type:complete